MDVSLSEDGVSSETSEDFELLNLVFEEELDEDVDENEDEILLNFNMNEEDNQQILSLFRLRKQMKPVR